MRLRTLVRRNLQYHWRANFAVVIGVAAAVRANDVYHFQLLKGNERGSVKLPLLAVVI